MNAKIGTREIVGLVVTALVAAGLQVWSDLPPLFALFIAGMAGAAVMCIDLLWIASALAFVMTAKPPKRPRDANQLAKSVVDIATATEVGRDMLTKLQVEAVWVPQPSLSAFGVDAVGWWALGDDGICHEIGGPYAIAG